VSTDDQSPALQIDALRQAGCDTIFEEHISGAAKSRPALGRALKRLRPGDTLVIWKLDRLGRSLPHLLDVVAGLDRRKIGFRSLSEAIDTTTAGGRLLFHVMGALAEFERSLIAERTKAGMAAAKARGKHIGRPKRALNHQCPRMEPIDDPKAFA
jgi:DNA invertase Pin-like site-specific DNA recombinase